jgi:hypothetical protein
MLKLYAKLAALDQNTNANEPHLRKQLNGDAMIQSVREVFDKVPDHRSGNPDISISDALMSAFAMFYLKDPSLLAFDKRRKKEPENLHSVFHIVNIPCDSQMREICDPTEIEFLRQAYRVIFRGCQRGNLLKEMTFLDGHYLLSGDGTTYYTSKKVSSPSCLIKTSNGKTIYSRQMYAVSMVHPDRREVIPFCPEMITNQDGATKNDCERNAARRFYEKFRREHPHLKVIVTEDGLSPNAPHINDLQRLDLRFFLMVKPGDHVYLFEQVEQAIATGKSVEFERKDQKDPNKTHYFCYVNGMPLNKTNQDVVVNFLEYWEVDKDKITHFTWVTDIRITEENAFKLMRGGRAHWKIENETFNTLKNQGYNFEHNYGLGKKNLSSVFALLMMLAFLIDQVQQMSCTHFQAAWKKAESKKTLWEHVRSLFHSFMVDSMATIYRAIAYGFERISLAEACKT